jgi:RNA polymerase sigma-70 factor, ECF subfamily
MSAEAGRPDEDAELVRRAMAKDTDAFGQLYERHRERVYRVAYHFVRNQTDALDLCQEAFVRAYEALPSFAGKARFSTWLLRIAANTSVDFCRSATVRRAGTLGENLGTGDERVPASKEPFNPAKGLERQELRVALDAALSQLSPEHRAAFVLHAVEGMSYKEIAETIGCPIGTVMSRLHYARKRLQGLLAWVKRA